MQLEPNRNSNIISVRFFYISTSRFDGSLMCPIYISGEIQKHIYFGRLVLPHSTLFRDIGGFSHGKQLVL